MDSKVEMTKSGEDMVYNLVAFASLKCPYLTDDMD